MLGLSLENWNSVLLGSLAVGALVAAIGVVATYAVIHLQRVENEAATAALEGYKQTVAAEIANAKARTAEAELALANLRKRVAPRGILESDFLKSIE